MAAGRQSLSAQANSVIASELKHQVDEKAAGDWYTDFECPLDTAWASLSLVPEPPTPKILSSRIIDVVRCAKRLDESLKTSHTANCLRELPGSQEAQHSDAVQLFASAIAKAVDEPLRDDEVELLCSAFELAGYPGRQVDLLGRAACREAGRRRQSDQQKQYDLWPKNTRGLAVDTDIGTVDRQAADEVERSRAVSSGGRPSQTIYDLMDDYIRAALGMSNTDHIDRVTDQFGTAFESWRASLCAADRAEIIDRPGEARKHMNRRAAKRRKD